MLARGRGRQWLRRSATTALCASSARRNKRESTFFLLPSSSFSLAEEVELDASGRQEVGDRAETRRSVARPLWLLVSLYLRLEFEALRKRRSCRCAFTFLSLLLLLLRTLVRRSQGSSWCCGREKKKKKLKCWQKFRKVGVRAFLTCPTRSQTDAESVS